MEARSIDLSNVSDAQLIDIPKLAELQIELRALHGFPNWQRDIKPALLGCLAPGFVIGGYLARRAASPPTWDFIACFVMTLLPLTAACIFWERRSKQLKLMEAMLHLLVEQQNDQRRQIELLQA
jgi:hypothetical protein